MTPFRLSGSANIVNVSSGGPRHSWETEENSNSFPTFLNLFTSPNAPIDGSEERASKRRKVESGDNEGLKPVDKFDDNKSVVLAKVSLELSLPALSDDEIDRLHASSRPQDPLVVSFESFATDWRYPHHFRITVSSTRVPSTIVDIVATARNDFLDSATSHMKTAALLATTTHGKERPNNRGVSFSRCTLAPPSGSQKFFRLETEIRWTVDVSLVEEQGIKPSRYKEELRMLADYFPDKSRELNGKWSLSDFYDSVHVPSTSLSISPRIQKGMAETLLYPFQQRAVDWLLRREGVSYDDAGLLQPVSDATTPVSFRAAQDATGKQCFVSVLRGLVVSDLSHARDTLQSLRGGILAEEMGLGKTVELIALMCHHKRDIPDGNVYDNYTGMFVKPSSATLIISPPSILEQWINEINTHAPELKVLHYKGLPSATAPKKEHNAATVENLMQYDVVVTTYNVLSKEIYFATPPPDRSLRNEKRHARRKSPLVEISWWRVCLDEAQMVESGVSQAATVARIIPRCNAWAVSGTPLRKNVQDLRGLLIFLRYDSLANNKAIWDRIDKGSFRAIFSQIALRHTKDRIREELRLPPQKRVVITVPFTAIEEQNYSEMIRQMCEACWLSPDGIPLDENRDADHPEVIERMRDWLIRLRQTCLHAHVGRKNRRALGARNGALRTVHEVLEVMIEQNDMSLKAAAREMILCQMRCGHIVAYAGNIGNRAESSLPFYKKALEEAESYVKVCREELQAEKEKLNSSSTTQRALPATEEQDSDSDDEDKQGEILGRIPVIRKTLRSFLALEHAGNFFIGTVYYQIKANEKLTEPDSEDFHRLEKLEVEWYDKAKKIRKEILRDSQNRAQRQIKRISSKKPFHQIPEIKDLTDLGGIESRKILDVMDHVTDVLNAQAAQIQTWRSKIVEILLMPLVDEDEGKETTGEEYEDSTKVQDELYIYIMALRTIVADRNAAVNGVQDILVDHELKIAEKSALKKEGHAPDLVLEVVETRRKLLSGGAVGSLKGVVSGIRSVITTLQWKADSGDARASAELAIAQKQLTQIQAITTEQTKIILELEKEQEMFRATMNQRLEFYRQLQHISDTVAPWREELEETLNKAEFVKYSKNGERAQKQLSSLKTKHAYLANLRRENQQEDLKHECIICQDEFEIGVLTTCGHKYCKECINQWWYAHRTCPLCKQKLATSDFKDINFKPSAAKAQEENHETGSSSQASTPGSSSTSIYSDISDATMKEIKMIDLDGSYGTKVDMIARHLIWIRNNDPGAKSIIFSQFGDFLEVLREALHRWKIGVSGISDKNGIHKFKTDPAVECFLLDAKSDSSGLNLVNATYVFLCEPLINPAIELQAIARVHRIGQQRPTTVFMYLVSDTVEEAIYDISVSRRLEHMGRTKNTGGSRSGSMTPVLQEKTLDAANSMELEAAPLKQLLRKKGDGEIVQADDLWNCLFGRKRKQHRAVLDREVDRHLRATAAEARGAVGDGS